MSQQPTPARPAASRYVFIDALRGFAALAVVLFHAHAGHHIDQLYPQLPAPLQWIFYYGNTGVFAFFVISGFVITHSLGNEPVSLGYVGRFLLRRAIRLDPPYWASMLLCVAMAYVSTHVVKHEVYTFPSFGNVMLHVTYLVDLVQAPIINDVYWTLCLEIQFYLVLAFLMFIVTAIRKRSGTPYAFEIVMWPCVLFANLWPLHVAPFHVPGLFLGQWYMFLIGALVWRALDASAPRALDSTPRAPRAALAAASVNLAVLGVVTLVRQDVPLGVGVSVGTLILVVGLRGRLKTLLTGKAVQTLGTISYSLYLIHNPLTGAAFYLGFRALGRTAATEALLVVLVTSGCVLASWVFYKLIEGPSQQLSKRIQVRA